MPEKRLPRSLQGLDDLFTFLDAELESHQVDAGTTFVVRFAAEELMTNMVRHNEPPPDGDGRIGFAVEVHDDRVEARLTDYGAAPYEPTAADTANADAPPEERRPGGLGIHLTRQQVDHLEYQHRDGNMVVSFSKNRSHGHE